MRSIYRKFISSLRAKMLAMFVVLTTIPLVTVGLTSYEKSFRTISAYSEAATMNVAEQLVRNIDVLFQDVGRLLELEKNPAVLQFLFSQTNSYEDAKEILRAFDLNRKTYAYDNVLNISMVNLYGRGISERKGVFALDKNPLRNPHFQYLLNHPEDRLIVPPSQMSALDRLDGFQYSGGNVFSLIGTVKHRITHEVVGFIVIDVDGAFLKRFADSYIIGNTGYFLIMDERGNPLYSPDAAMTNLPLSLNSHLGAAKDSFVIRDAGKPVFVTFATSTATNWKIVGIAPLQEIVNDAHEIRQLIIVSAGLSIVLIIALYFLITNRLTRPIQILKNKMRHAESGYLNAKVRPEGSDELAELGRSYNSMIEKIKALLERSVHEEKQRQKAELRTLQAQIHPHFLYNTMDSIVWMAEAGKNERVIELVKALSRFFRISLSKGKDWITIREEVEHARNYLVIQQIRYRDILIYDIEVDDAAARETILKMTLQPLVENAIYHGIKNKRGLGTVRIRGYLDSEETVVLVVEDDGIGMDEQTLDTLRKQIAATVPATEDNNEQSSGYGLFNVAQRIRLYYGTDYGLEIQSKFGTGTRVSVRVPRNAQGESP